MVRQAVPFPICYHCKKSITQDIHLRHISDNQDELSPNLAVTVFRVRLEISDQIHPDICRHLSHILGPASFNFDSCDVVMQVVKK